MTPEQWKQLSLMVQGALLHPSADLESCLERAGADDDVLRREVTSLIAAYRAVREKGLTESLPDFLRRMSGDLFRPELPDLEPGSYLASYRIESLLGRGGMGVVYRARDEKLHREVAIKVLSPRTFQDAEARRRFLTEARALAQLNHPNVLTLYDVECAEHVSYIVMEWIAGRTLHQVIRRQAMRLDDALKYAIQIADALTQAHARGIVHRDLKPANVMVTAEDLIKVLDFGLAKFVRRLEIDASTAGDSTLQGQCTDTGRILGTAAYMSPEQARGMPVDRRSDVFSFGSMLYEMVSGRRAFAGGSLGEVTAAILTAEPTPYGLWTVSRNSTVSSAGFMTTACATSKRPATCRFSCSEKTKLSRVDLCDVAACAMR